MVLPTIGRRNCPQIPAPRLPAAPLNNSPQTPPIAFGSTSTVTHAPPRATVRLMRTPLPPDAYAAAAILLAIALEFLVPLPILPPFALISLPTLIGAALAIAGLLLELSAARALTNAHTTTRPNQPPSALVTSGPFTQTRNPFYLGILILLAGLALIASLDWSIILLPLFWLALDRLVVPHEEQKLRDAFPAEWEGYSTTTPKWLGKVVER